MGAAAANVDRAPLFLREESVSKTRSTRFKATNQLIVQAELLKKFGFEATSNLIAEWAIERFNRMEPEVKIYLLTLGDANLRVVTLPDLLVRKPSLIRRETMELLYPKPFASFFEAQVALSDPYLLWAISRKESRVDP